MKSPRFIALALALATLALFAPVRHFEFLNYDDNVFVTQHALVRGGLTLDGVRGAFTAASVDYWRPVSWLSHMVDVQLFGLDAGAHHLVNVVLHAANVVLVFLVVLRFAGRDSAGLAGAGLANADGAPVLRGAFVAAAFAFHPLHVESVAWIAERKDVLCAFFWLLTLLAYERHVQTPSNRRFAAVLGFFALALMSKPMAVTLPFVLLLLDYWPLRRAPWPFRWPGEGRKPDAGQPAPQAMQEWGRLVREKWLLFAMAAAGCIATWWSTRQIGAMHSVESVSPGARLANAVVGYADYLRLLLWPEGLAVIYPLPDAWPASRVLVSTLVVAGLTAIVLRLSRSRPFAVVGWLWFVGMLIPVIGLVQVGSQSIADRYTYLPSIGLFIALAWALPDLLKRTTGAARALPWVAAGLIVASAVATRAQLAHWRDSVSLFDHAIHVTEKNWVAHNNLGNALMHAKRFSEAARQYELALAARPDNVESLYNLGVLRSAEGKGSEAGALYTRVLRADSRHPRANNNLGNLVADQGRVAEAVPLYQAALAALPDFAEAHFNLANALADLGKPDDALLHYRAALRLEPWHPQANYNAGNLVAARGDLRGAARLFEQAIRTQPDYAPAHFNLGAVLLQLGQASDAVGVFRSGLKLDGNSIEGHFNLAQALARLGRAEESRAHMETAQRLQAARAKQP